MAISFGASTDRGSVSSDANQITSKKRVLSPEAQNKIIYDILSADRGLADLVSGAGMVGGSGSSSTGLMAQDFIAKAVGEIALLTAEEISSTDSTTKQVEKKSSAGAKTVICTELARQGKLDLELYEAGHAHFKSLHPNTVRGYHVWANRVVALMQKSERLSNFIAPIAHGRYLMTTGKADFTFWGVVTICIGQPLCYLIGSLLPKEVSNGSQSAV